MVTLFYLDGNVVKISIVHYYYQIVEAPFLKIFPFGVNVNDLPGPPGDDSASRPLALSVQFPFFGRKYSKIIVRITKLIWTSLVSDQPGHSISQLAVFMSQS